MFLIVGLFVVLIVFPLLVLWFVLRLTLFGLRVLGELFGAWAASGRY